MGTNLTSAGSLSLLLDIIPVIVIIIVIILFVVSRHRYMNEKRELDAVLSEYESEQTEDSK